jgi:hypothetical protein
MIEKCGWFGRNQYNGTIRATVTRTLIFSGKAIGPIGNGIV